MGDLFWHMILEISVHHSGEDMIMRLSSQQWESEGLGVCVFISQ